jgi:hypothetical protein
MSATKKTTTDHIYQELAGDACSAQRAIGRAEGASARGDQAPRLRIVACRAAFAGTARPPTPPGAANVHWTVAKTLKAVR